MPNGLFLSTAATFYRWGAAICASGACSAVGGEQRRQQSTFYTARKTRRAVIQYKMELGAAISGVLQRPSRWKCAVETSTTPTEALEQCSGSATSFQHRLDDAYGAEVGASGFRAVSWASCRAARVGTKEPSTCIIKQQGQSASNPKGAIPFYDPKIMGATFRAVGAASQFCGARRGSRRCAGALFARMAARSHKRVAAGASRNPKTKASSAGNPWGLCGQSSSTREGDSYYHSSTMDFGGLPAPGRPIFGAGCGGWSGPRTFFNANGYGGLK